MYDALIVMSDRREAFQNEEVTVEAENIKCSKNSRNK